MVDLVVIVMVVGSFFVILLVKFGLDRMFGFVVGSFFFIIWDNSLFEVCLMFLVYKIIGLWRVLVCFSLISMVCVVCVGVISRIVFVFVVLVSEVVVFRFLLKVMFGRYFGFCCWV